MAALIRCSRLGSTGPLFNDDSWLINSFWQNECLLCTPKDLEVCFINFKFINFILKESQTYRKV